MANKTIDISRPIFMPIKDVVKITGLSEWYLRQELKAGRLPHLRNGKRILVNLPKLLAQLDAQ